MDADWAQEAVPIKLGAVIDPLFIVIEPVVKLIELLTDVIELDVSVIFPPSTVIPLPLTVREPVISAEPENGKPLPEPPLPLAITSLAYLPT